MGLNTAGVVNALESLAVATGLFAKVNLHEPKRAPTGDLNAAIFMAKIDGHAAASGLATSSAVSVFTMRLFSNMLQEPQDAIDPAVMVATDTILTDLHADFTLGGTATVDLHGMSENRVGAVAGYVDIDGSMFRVVDITVPCVTFDAWPQTA